VPTELVVYPGEYHVLTRPSFLKDRAERYIAWYGKYLQNVPAELTKAAAPSSRPE
jgi:dipeptidyl aminopeptidase/acylaminoacyl peptidase